jgi:hypothetical protein
MRSFLTFYKSASLVLVCLFFAAGSAGAQNQTPSNSGPTGDAFMKLIPDALKSRGSVSYTMTFREGSTSGTIRISEAVSDPTSCTLRITTISDNTYESGQTHTVNSATIPLKEIENVVVESEHDYSRRFAREENLDLSNLPQATVTPEYYGVTLVASKPVIKTQATVTSTDPQMAADMAGIPDHIFSFTGFFFPDRETAVGVAKILSPALAFCRGEQKSSSQ